MSYLSDNHQLIVQQVEKYLATLFEHALLDAKAISPSYERLWHSIEIVSLSGGKRIRPYLTLLGYKLGTATTDITPIAAAHELLHIAVLMHDDIIDRDNVRHGTPNINGIYETIYTENVEGKDRTHYAYGAGILAGDLLISAAYRSIIDSQFSAEDQRLALDLLNQSIFEVAGGELMDVEAAFMKTEQHDALSIALHKTATYSIVGPLLAGAKLAHVSNEDIERLRHYAVNLGIAFQIQDDLLGMFGDEAETGKTTLGDIREAKRTYLIEQFIAVAGSAEKQLFDAVFGNPSASNEDVTLLKNHIKESEAYKQAIAAVDRYAVLAAAALEDLVESEAKQELLQLIIRLSRRTH